ncbi:MAG: hypothetical protein KAH48_03975 [Chlorobi bacterium]|nr:hypothetical protein [Chlorobiota bacterium]
MKIRGLVSKIGLTTLAVAATISMNSCTPMITEEQQMKINELKTQERQLTEGLSSKKREISKLNSEVSARNAELKKCKDDTEFVQSKLASWPNSWPDWKPEVPVVEEEEAK